MIMALPGLVSYPFLERKVLGNCIDFLSLSSFLFNYLRFISREQDKFIFFLPFFALNCVEHAKNLITTGPGRLARC